MVDIIVRPYTPNRNVRQKAVNVHEAPNEQLSPRRSPRIKKNASITPNRFNKFFQSTLSNAKTSSVRTSRKALQNLSAANLNNRLRSSGVSATATGQDGPPPKRRRLSFSSVLSLPSSPIRPYDDSLGNRTDSHATSGTRPTRLEDTDEEDYDTDVDEMDENSEEDEELPTHWRVSRYHNISSAAGSLSRQLGGRLSLREGNDTKVWQQETCDFYSLPTDMFTNPANDATRRALPFCAASFHQHESVAMANEDGQIEIYRAWPRMDNYEHSLRFECSIYPHDNALMDMEFSPDDHFLATASGDQTCRIIDMNTRTGTHTLVGHGGSVKNVRWQPGSGNNILATCSRDGGIILWDLRCASTELGSLKVKPLTRGPHFLDNSREVLPSTEIVGAHKPFDKLKTLNGKRRSVPLSSKADFAVTACAFISETRPHMLATASEHNAIVKLWDMRTSYVNRSGRPTPVSVSATVEPKSHTFHRPFGVTSIVMSTDGSRLYTLCRDNTIYAYSTGHLVLGGGPEMTTTSASAFKASRGTSAGLGPLYGFRHEKLRLGSFYDKLSLRPKTDENTEILSTGTGEDCAVLFPTDERYLTKRARHPYRFNDVPVPRSSHPLRRPLLQRTSSSLVNTLTTAIRATESEEDPTPIYHHGTPLLNGHKKEVTCAVWVPGNGQLVTVSDDYTARCWYEDNAAKARTLRMGKQKDAERMQSGWAGVVQGWDDDEA